MTIAGLFRRFAWRAGEVQPRPLRSATARTTACATLLDRPDRMLWAVADAIGTDAGSGIAAAVAIDALSGLADAGAPIGPAAIRIVLEAVTQALAADGLGSLGTSGAALVALHLDGEHATVLWAGDSRAYLLRDDRLRQLTTDHSVVQEMIAAGTLPLGPASAAHTRVVTRAIAASAVEVDRVDIEVRPGDVLLLCPHGLSDAVPAAMIAGRLRGPFEDAPGALIEAALAAGAGGPVSVAAVAID